MALKTINIGQSANDKTGTKLREAFGIVNTNMDKIQEQLDQKLAGADLDEKADKTYVDEQLKLKANADTVQTLTSQLAGKADASALSAKADTTALKDKANTSTKVSGKNGIFVPENTTLGSKAIEIKLSDEAWEALQRADVSALSKELKTLKLTNASHVFDKDFANSVGGYPSGSILLGSDGATLWLSVENENFTDPNSAAAKGWVKIGRLGADDIGAGLALSENGTLVIGDDLLRAGLRVGDQKLSPFRSEAFWYLMNGDNFLLTSPQGQALNGLSADYKADWGIVVSVVNGQNVINVPNYFDAAGNGYFDRAVNGTNRRVGSRQGDAIRNIYGYFGFNGNAYCRAWWMSSGAFVNNGNNPAPSIQNSNNSGQAVQEGVYFDAARQVPVAAENRPINIGKTPLIYLGV